MTLHKKLNLRAFIGCSSEGLELAQALFSEIDRWCYPELWDQGIFDLSKTIIESLEIELPKYDFTIFILTADDIAIVRGEKHSIPRDNLIFELGLSYAFLGRTRTFMILPKDSNLKLPTDIAGVIPVEYDPAARNLRSALTTASQRIKNSLQNREGTRPCDYCKTHLAHLLTDVGRLFYRELDLIFAKTAKLVFSKGVIRRNWTINLSYDFSNIDKNIIREKIIWDYEFINITKSDIEYPHIIFMLDGDSNTLVDLSRADDTGKRIKIFHSGDKTKSEDADTVKDHTFIKKEKVLTLPPGISHYMRLQFLLDHPVCPNTHHIHNSFAPREVTMSATIKAVIPNGYRIGILAEDKIEPSKFENDWDFRIPGPLFPEQVIEYIFQKEEGCE